VTENESGIVEVPSRHSIGETIDRIEAALRAKGVTLFAVEDHGGEAAKIGLAMPPTQLLIFGSPNTGTPVMLASPSSALDLPLKILVREDPRYTQHGPHLPRGDRGELRGHGGACPRARGARDPLVDHPRAQLHARLRREFRAAADGDDLAEYLKSL
jgi:hypothetical protein